ncbi:excinuclease ABC subunit A [Corallincola platygyrae]|uniref:Excinuclease ABC subunit A n=1 Tax=Corallincola platygyrae TaxID=1193278 RepID=A0ABW4XHT8_9GAMM
MKSLIIATISALIIFSSPSQARDDLVHLNIEQVLTSSKAAGVLNPNIKLYFGEQSYPAPSEHYGEVVTNKKTNAFGKSDEEACSWVFLSAIKALQQRAVREGHNAVVDITSYYKKNEYKSNEEFECGAGTLMAGVALKGKIVSL